MLLFAVLSIIPFFLVANTSPIIHEGRAPCVISAKDIQTIAPDTSICNTTAQYASECSPAAHAAPFVALSYAHYDISSFGAQAALLSLMLYETGSFKYDKNHWPGVPGQGTRNMQSPAFNLKYAEWLATNAPCENINQAAVMKANATGPVAVLDLLLDDVPSFGSAAWFLTTQCDPSIEDGLAKETKEGWESYLTDCVGTTATDDRTAIWTKAIALGHW
ncbi:hypothetical protein AAFC00_007298 [Neodothiora populina]|uniref:Uncharacterized protein n=1 Tax=Neodothiora populina TaxID=2781224 RepID=A0ABR3PHU0_9PEZI